MTEFLNSQELEILSKHRYQSSGYSKLDNLMKPFWVKTAKYIPYVIFKLMNSGSPPTWLL
jgi:hypothetical protein